MFDIRLRRYTAAGVRGAVLRTLTIDATDGAASVVSASVSRLVAGDLVTPFVVALEYNAGGGWVEVRNGRMVVTDDDMQDTGDLSQVVSFTGRPQVAWQLGKALVSPSTFTNVSAGSILVPLLTAAQTRGWGPGITWDFSGSVDSLGRTWPTGDKINLTITDTPFISTILDALATQGLIEWWTEGLKLVVVLPKVGADHSTDIVLGPGATRSPRSTRSDIVTHLTVIPEGTDRFVMTNTGALGDFGRLEGVMTQSGVTDRPTAEKLAQPALDDAKTSIADQSVEYPASTAPALPWLDYAVGDQVSTRQGSVDEVRRVVEFAVRKTVEGQLTVTTTTGHRFKGSVAKVHDIAAAGVIASNAGGSGSSLPPSTAPADKTDPPTTPTLKTFQSSVLVKWNGLLTTGAPPPGLKSVIAEASPNGTSGWIQAATDFTLGEAEFPASLVGVGAGGTVHVRLRAVNTKGVLSDPSTVVSIVVEGVKTADLDAAVSGAISDAAAAAAAAQSTADGKTTISPNAPVAGDAAGKPMGAIWWQQTSGTVVGMWEKTGTSTWTARPLGAGSIASSAITDAKIATGAVLEAKIADAAVATAKLQDSSVSTVKIANLAVGSAKIADAAIVTAKIGDLAVSTAKIADAAIVTAKIGDAAITNAKIDDLAVTDAKIANLNIGKATAGTLDVARLGANSINATKMLLAGENLIGDPYFSYPTNAWALTAGVTVSAGVLSGTSNSTDFTYAYPRGIGTSGAEIRPATPFTNWRFQIEIRKTTTGTTGSVGIRQLFCLADFSSRTYADVAKMNLSAMTQNVWYTVTGTSEFPAGKTNTGLAIHTTTSGVGIEVRAVSMMVMATGSLVVDGAIDGKVITGATVRTASSGQRVQLDTVGLRAYNASDAVTASLTASTGGLVLSGTLETAASGLRSVLGGAGVTFYNGSTVLGSVSASSVGGGTMRILGPSGEVLFSFDSSGTSSDMGLYVPFLESTALYVGLGDAVVDSVSGYGRFRGGLGGSINLGSDGAERVAIEGVYNRTATTSANVYISSANTLGRATSVKAAKLDVEDQEIDPLAILNISPRTWIDRGAVTRAIRDGYDEEEKRIHGFGAVVEEVEPHAPYLVMRNGETGEPDGLSYDRVGFALIPTLRYLVEQVAELKGQPAPVWPESPTYDDTAIWAEITEATE